MRPCGDRPESLFRPSSGRYPDVERTLNGRHPDAERTSSGRDRNACGSGVGGKDNCIQRCCYGVSLPSAASRRLDND